MKVEKKIDIDLIGPTWHCVVGRNFGSFVTHGKVEVRYCILNVFIYV